MERNVLLVLGNGYNRENLIDSAVYLRDNFGFSIRPLHVRDVRKKEFLPNAVDGIMLEPMIAGINEEWNRYEEHEIANIKEQLKERGVGAELEVKFGITPEVVIEELKKSDILLIEKEDKFSEDLIAILKRFFKPIIVVRDKVLKLDKVAISNDDGTKVNKSFQRFINIFTHVDEITSLELIDPQDHEHDDDEVHENYLNEFIKGKGIKLVSKKIMKANSDEFLKIAKEEDVLIMGNLSNSYIFEKITKKVGVKIMEDVETTLFIA